MRSDTRTITLEASAEHAFAFLADARNLPRWAVGFAHSIRPEGDAWVVQTSQGEMNLSMTTIPACGVIDFHMSPAPGVLLTAYSRVVPHEGFAEYIFTQSQSPDMPDSAFDAQVETLREELKVLQSIIKARGVCPN